MAAHAIDHGGPALLLQRLAGRGQLGTGDNSLGTQRLQIIFFFHSASGGHHFKAQGLENGHGHAAHATRSACDQDFTLVWMNTMPLQGLHTEHGGVARRANGHALFGVECLGLGREPCGFNPRPLREATPVGLSHTPAIENDRIARREHGVVALLHGACEVDARDHGELAHYAGSPTATGNGKAIFEVNGGVVHTNGDIAFTGLWQVVLGDRFHGRGNGSLGRGLSKNNGSKHGQFLLGKPLE